MPNKINKIKIKIYKSKCAGAWQRGSSGFTLHMCVFVCELRWVVLLFINIKLVKYLNGAANLAECACVFVRDERFMWQRLFRRSKNGETCYKVRSLGDYLIMRGRLLTDLLLIELIKCDIVK